MSDYIDTVDIEGTQYDIQDTATKAQAETNAQDISEMKVSQNYSTTEHLTGRKWIDGRPTYEKTIDCGALPNTGVKDVPHGISDFLFFVKGNLATKDPSANVFCPTSFVFYTPQASIGFYIDGSNVRLCAGQNRTSFTQTFVTLEYTKSTDSPQP